MVLYFDLCIHACSVAKSCPSLWDPVNCSLPGSFINGILSARILVWLPFIPPEDLPDPGIKPMCLVSPALAGRFFTTELPGKPQRRHTNVPANWHTNWCLISLIKEMQIKITMRCHTHQSEWPSLKSLWIINTGEDVEKQEVFCMVGGNINWGSHYGGQYVRSLKTKNRATIWSWNFTPGHICRENFHLKRYMHPVFIAALFKIAKIWK